MIKYKITSCRNFEVTINLYSNATRFDRVFIAAVVHYCHLFESIGQFMALFDDFGKAFRGQRFVICEDILGVDTFYLYRDDSGRYEPTVVIVSKHQQRADVDKFVFAAKKSFSEMKDFLKKRCD